MAATNPFDQFDAPKQTANPFDQFDAKATSVKPSSSAPAPTTDSSAVSFLTSPQFANESLAQEAKDIGLSTADYLALNQLKRVVPTSVGDAIAQAHQNLGYADYGIGAGAYLLGPGKVLRPLAAGAGLGGLGTTALEGAMAGGISGFDPNAPIGSTLTGAAAGGALGGAAHVAGKAVGGMANRLGPQIDPAAAVVTTKAMRDQAYAPLKSIAFDPNDVLGAHSSATLTPGMDADVSPGMRGMLARQQTAIQNGGNTANDIADYVTNLRSAGGSPSASNGDRILTGQTADALEGLLANGQPITGHAPGEAMQTLTNARQVHQQYASALALQDYAYRLKTFGIGPGMDPVNQAQFYNPQTQGDQVKTWADLYKQGAGGGGGLAYPLTHIAAEGAEGLAAASGLGGPATMGVGALAHLAKLPIKKLMNVYDKARYAQGIQKAYPTVTGMQAGITPSSPYGSAGDAIKALMLSQGSQQGF